MLLIGLTGERGVGKSEIAKYLQEKHGFGVSHAFEVGKRLTMHYYVNELQIPFHTATRMVYEDLKDTPSEYLPDGSTSRHFMEELGYCMGNNLGPKWTLGLEMKRLLKDTTKTGYIFESIVYEAGAFVEQGGIIIRVERDNRNSDIQATHTSDAQKKIKHQVLLNNHGSFEDLYFQLDTMVDTLQSHFPFFENLQLEFGLK